ncbi:hypothetical protein ACK3TF_003038 [Chlorella vulgaris]
MTEGDISSKSSVAHSCGSSWLMVNARQVAASTTCFEHNSHLQEVKHRIAGAANTDVRHERQILHEPAGLPFRCLCRADHAPLAVVQLAWLGNFALAADGRVDAPQMAQCGGVGGGHATHTGQQHKSGKDRFVYHFSEKLPGIDEGDLLLMEDSGIGSKKNCMSASIHP